MNLSVRLKARLKRNISSAQTVEPSKSVSNKRALNGVLKTSTSGTASTVQMAAAAANFEAENAVRDPPEQMNRFAVPICSSSGTVFMIPSDTLKNNMHTAQTKYFSKSTSAERTPKAPDESLKTALRPNALSKTAFAHASRKRCTASAEGSSPSAMRKAASIAARSPAIISATDSIISAVSSLSSGISPFSHASTLPSSI